MGQISGAFEFDRAHILPYRKFNGDILAMLIFSDIDLTVVVGAEKFNKLGSIKSMVRCVSAI